jgi:hypothetical protein
MSHAEYASRPVPVFTKLAGMLRNIPAVQFVFAKFAALLRSDKGNDKPPISKFLGEAPGVASNTVDHHVAILKSTGDIVIAVPESNDRSEREKLIRRRWTETGIKMWNPNVHGEGHAALNIQGRVELLPVKPGETLPGYDKLEFKLIGGSIVCEGVIVDPPKSRRKPGADLFA